MCLSAAQFALFLVMAPMPVTADYPFVFTHSRQSVIMWVWHSGVLCRGGWVS